MTSSHYVNTDVCYAIRYNVTVAVHIAEWACANPLLEQNRLLFKIAFWRLIYE